MTMENTLTQSSKETKKLALICTVSTPEYLDAIEIPRKSGSTHSYMEQEMRSLVHFLERGLVAGRMHGSLSLVLSLHLIGSSKKLVDVSKLEVICGDSMDVNYLSDHLIRLLTPCSSLLAQSS